MRLQNPTQALLWKCWRRSGWQFLLVMVGLLTLMLPLLGLDIFATDPAQRNEITRSFVVAALFVLWAACPGLSYNPRSTLQGIGFVFDNDFVRPVATGTLVFIPMLYVCVLAALAYLLPTWLLSVLFDTAPPSMGVLFIVVEVTLLVSAVQWGSSNIWIAWASWLGLFGLAWAGWIIPEPLAKDEMNMFVTPPLQAFIQPVLIMGLALVLLRMNVVRMRSGEQRANTDTQKFSSPFFGFRASEYLPVLKQSCPTTSPLRATWWREQRQHGIANNIVFGIAMALCSMLTMYLLERFGEIRGEIGMPQIVGLSFSWFSVVCIFAPLSMFDVDFTGQSARISPFSRTRPIRTVTLVTFKTFMTISGLLAAALAMAITMLIAGPLFIADFYAIVSASWQGWLDGWQYSLFETVSRALMVLAIFTSVICIYSAFATWLFLNAKKLMWYLLSIPAYLVLVLALVIMVTEPEELQGVGVQLLALHLWLVLIGFVGVTIYFLAIVMRDRVLRQTQLAALLLGTGFIWVLHLLYTRDENIFGPERVLVFAVADNLQGLLPLFAAALMLWTLHRVRHT